MVTSVLPLPVLARFRAWSREHAERGCGGGAVTFGADGLLRGPCQCDCPDHRCAETAAEMAGEFSVCRRCRDTRYVVARCDIAPGHPAFGRAEPCPDCNGPGMPNRVEFLKMVSNVPWDWWMEKRLDLLDPGSSPRAQVEQWLRDGRRRRPFLVLTGNPGTGKTHAAVGAGARLIQDDLTVYFTTATDLLDELRATFDRPGISADDVLRSPKSAGCLILDDLGAERQTDWTAERLFSLVNHRYERRMLTIVTTNLSSREAPVADRLWSRVFGDRVAFVVKTAGPDRRRTWPRPLPAGAEGGVA